MASFKSLAIKLPLFLFLCVSYNRPALAEQIIGLSSVDIPEYLTQRSLGLRYENIHKFEILRILDQRSLEISIFPSLEIDRAKVLSEQKKRNDHSQVSHYLSIVDISPTLEKCLYSFACLGLAPLSAQLYVEDNHIRPYFSPAVSLRFQYIDENDRRWDLKFQTKLYFDQNFNEMISHEVNMISIGRSL